MCTDHVIYWFGNLQELEGHIVTLLTTITTMDGIAWNVPPKSQASTQLFELRKYLIQSFITGRRSSCYRGFLSVSWAYHSQWCDKCFDDCYHRLGKAADIGCSPAYKLRHTNSDPFFILPSRLSLFPPCSPYIYPPSHSFKFNIQCSRYLASWSGWLVPVPIFLHSTQPCIVSMLVIYMQLFIRKLTFPK